MHVDAKRSLDDDGVFRSCPLRANSIVSIPENGWCAPLQAKERRKGEVDSAPRRGNDGSHAALVKLDTVAGARTIVNNHHSAATSFLPPGRTCGSEEELLVDSPSRVQGGSTVDLEL